MFLVFKMHLQERIIWLNFLATGWKTWKIPSYLGEKVQLYFICFIYKYEIIVFPLIIRIFRAFVVSYIKISHWVFPNMIPDFLRPNIRLNSTLFQDLMTYLEQSANERSDWKKCWATITVLLVAFLNYCLHRYI